MRAWDRQGKVQNYNDCDPVMLINYSMAPATRRYVDSTNLC